jgi:hypothetical protein
VEHDATIGAATASIASEPTARRRAVDDNERGEEAEGAAIGVDACG